MMAFRRLLLVLSLFLAACAAVSSSAPVWREGTARSADGVAIHYVEGGSGATAVVFVHGWLGDASVWEPQMRRFAPRFQVVALDLAGHGGSGRERAAWSVENFAADVVAVADALGLRRMVLVGHSMAGPVTVAAANRLGERVVGLVPVDSILDVEWDLPPETWDQFLGGLRADFPTNVAKFFREILAAPGSPKQVIDDIVAKAQRADPQIAVPMIEGGRAFDLKGELRALRVPIRAIAGDQNPPKLETNRKYAPRFDAALVVGVGHWPHLEAPERFGNALQAALRALDV
jgi:pimeloyl-ACP methyl ester carboxylesterase